MRNNLVQLLAGASLLIIATGAQAQVSRSSPQPQEVQPTAEQTAQAEDTTSIPPEEPSAQEVGDILVTARRRSESLQNVPQTINAVSGNTLEKLSIQRFEDVQSLVPGLTLQSGNSGFSTSASLRGAPFSAEAGASPTVEFYLNDALTPSAFLFQSTYDVGQIEVLRGPQGTLRGRASPSGSITVTTRRPDLDEVGGFVNMTGTTRGGINFNGALNIPLINDVLGLRVAGIADENDADFVTSINNGASSFSHSKSGRASLRFEPVDFISANVVYQHIDRNQRLYDQVQSLSLADNTVTPSGRLIRAADRLAITDGYRASSQNQDIVTGQLNVRLAGQQLSYVGSYLTGESRTQTPADYANTFVGSEFYNYLQSTNTGETHELRLASQDRLFGLLDYTVGAFRAVANNQSNIDQGVQIAIGGRPVTTTRVPVTSGGGSKETSFFGNLTLHLGEATELSGGLRHITFDSDSALSVNRATVLSNTRHYTPIVYNASVSHRFSRNVLLYANTGTSWRAGPFITGVFQALTDRQRRYIDLDAEKSQSYEAGVKSTFFDGRFRFNLSGFRQDYDGFIYRGPLVPYLNSTSGAPTVTYFNFGANVDARVYGTELDLEYQVSRRFTIGGTFSYAKGKIRDSLVACIDLNGDGVPDPTLPAVITPAQLQAASGGQGLSECRVNDRLSAAPNFNFTLQSEYAAPLSGRADAFARGLFSYYGTNQGEARNPYDQVGSYGLLNLFAGIRASDGGWEVSFFGRNLTGLNQVLTNGATPVNTNYQALQPPTFRTAAGVTAGAPYVTTRATAPREFGLNVRFAFGSR